MYTRKCTGHRTSTSPVPGGSEALRGCENTAQWMCSIPHTSYTSYIFRRCRCQVVEPPSPTGENEGVQIRGSQPGTRGRMRPISETSPGPAEEGEPQEHTDAGHTIFSARSAPRLKLNVDMLELVLFQAKVPRTPGLVRQHEHAASSKRLLVRRVCVCVCVCVCLVKQAVEKGISLRSKKPRFPSSEWTVSHDFPC